MTRRMLPVAALGLVVFVGAFMVARQPRPQFGWVAYTPLSQATLSPGAIVLDAVGITALVVAGLGIALLAGTVGYGLGRKNAQGNASADSSS